MAGIAATVFDTSFVMNIFVFTRESFVVTGSLVTMSCSCRTHPEKQHRSLIAGNRVLLI